MIELFTTLFWITLIGIAACAFVILGTAINEQRRPQKKANHSQPKTGRKPAPYRHVPTQRTGNNQAAKAVSSQLQNKLLSLVNGDTKTVQRLLAHTRKTNPLQPETWIWEKAIFDLERDRA